MVNSFLLQSGSFLAGQRHLQQAKGKSNAEIIFKMERIPTDTYSHNLLDPVNPSEFSHEYRSPRWHREAGLRGKRRQAMGAWRTFFNDVAALTRYLIFSDWRSVLNVMFVQLGLEPD